MLDYDVTFFVQTISSEVVDVGIETEADIVIGMRRTTFFNDDDERGNYYKDVPMSILRIIPKIARQCISPFLRPQ